jgi:hypothetical protein
MGSFSFDIAGLICSFHVNFSLKKVNSQNSSEMGHSQELIKGDEVNVCELILYQI